MFVHVILCNKRYSFNENCSLNEITKGKNLFFQTPSTSVYFIFIRCFCTFIYIWKHNVCGMKDMFCSSYSTYLYTQAYVQYHTLIKSKEFLCLLAVFLLFQHRIKEMFIAKRKKKQNLFLFVMRIIVLCL